MFELAKQLPEYGVGARFARTRWEHRGAPDSYWTVSRMKPKPSGRAGRAWGTLTWKGEAKEGKKKEKAAAAQAEAEAASALGGACWRSRRR